MKGDIEKMINPFKNVRDTFEGIAVLAGDINGNLDGFVAKTEDYANQVNKITINSSKETQAAIYEEMERAFEYAIDFCNEMRVNIQKIVATTGKAEMFREGFLEIILSYNNLPRGYRIDESLVNFTPEATGVHFAEYIYNEETNSFEAKLDEDLGHYTAEGIVNNFIPQITDYYMTGMKIAGKIAALALNNIEKCLTSLQTLLLEMRDGTADFKIIGEYYRGRCKNIYDCALDIRKVYQICSNMVKNLEIIESAYTVFFKAENRVMTL